LPMGVVVPTSTVTVIVQLPATVALGAIGIVPPDNWIDVPPLAAVNVPPQVVAGAGKDAIVKPAPKVVSRS
jgi:hypothetical protein